MQALPSGKQRTGEDFPGYVQSLVSFCCHGPFYESGVRAVKFYTGDTAGMHAAAGVAVRIRSIQTGPVGVPGDQDAVIFLCPV